MSIWAISLTIGIPTFAGLVIMFILERADAVLASYARRMRRAHSGPVMSAPRLLDLFSCAGGAAMGYHRAGFDVVGVDIAPQPNYPFEFVRADAIEYLLSDWQHFDAIHASPPCQAYSAMKSMPDAKQHDELVDKVRDILDWIGKPYVVENVPGAPMRDPLLLCGSMFGLGAEGFQLRRHRLFDSNIDLVAPSMCDHRSPTIGVYGGHVRCRSSKFWRETGADFPGCDKKALANEAMGIDWMTMGQLSEAIPPAYTEHIGMYLAHAALLKRAS